METVENAAPVQHMPGPWRTCDLDTMMLYELGVPIQPWAADFVGIGVAEGPGLNQLVALVPPTIGPDGMPMPGNPNAALILAAPELLAALRLALPCINDNHAAHDGTGRRAVDVIRAAIAKAIGG